MGFRHHILAALVLLLISVVGTPGAADIHAGRASAAACSNCHGANGEGSGPNPPLAGMAHDRTTSWASGRTRR